MWRQKRIRKQFCWNIFVKLNMLIIKNEISILDWSRPCLTTTGERQWVYWHREGSWIQWGRTCRGLLWQRKMPATGWDWDTGGPVATPTWAAKRRRKEDSINFVYMNKKIIFVATKIKSRIISLLPPSDVTHPTWKHFIFRQEKVFS